MIDRVPMAYTTFLLPLNLVLVDSNADCLCSHKPV